MDSEKIIIGFLGAGGIARSHAFALNSLKYFYASVPEIEFEAVCSSRKESSDAFAAKFGFKKSLSIEEFRRNADINTVLIMGPNKVHFEHLKLALEMPSVKRIYLEKPVCSNLEEEQEMAHLATNSGKQIQVGFQYLQTASVREAISFWHSGKLGKPIHFDLKYYHGDYLQQAYRDKRQTRLTPAPDGGAMADLGSHGISLLMAFWAIIFKLPVLFRPESLPMFLKIPIYSVHCRWFSPKALLPERCLPAESVQEQEIWFRSKFMRKKECCVIRHIRLTILSITSKKPGNGHGR